MENSEAPVFEGSGVRLIPDLLSERVAATPEQIAFTTKTETVTWQQFGTRANGLAMSLRELGLKRGDAVAVMGFTCGEWAVTDQAILAAGGVCVGVYPNLRPKQIGYILGDCQAKYLFVGDAEMLKHARLAAKDAASLEQIIV